MARPWTTLDAIDTPDGRLELRRRGEVDYLITLAGRVLMNSAASRSEAALGRVAGELLAGRRAPRLLLGGLGMGCSLRAALDALPSDARLVVAELNRDVERWCRGPLAALTGGAVADPRVVVRLGDVADAVAEAARPDGERFDAVLLDLYEGPRPGGPPDSDPHYGSAALLRTRAALRPGGVLAIWSEERDPHFERQLARAGFEVRSQRPGRGGRRHVVYTARAH